MDARISRSRGLERSEATKAFSDQKPEDPDIYLLIL